MSRARASGPGRACRTGRHLVPAPSRGGFTLVELMVAIMILSIGVIALASAAGLVSRLIGGGAHQSLAAQTALTRFERMRGAACSSIAGGSATTRGITERWVVAKGDPATTVRVTDSVSFRTALGDRRQTFQSYIQCLP